MVCILAATASTGQLRAQATSELGSLLARGWQALVAGSPARAVSLADEALAELDEFDSPPDRVGEAHLLRAAGRYSQGEMEEATDAVRQVEDLERTLAFVDFDGLPAGFSSWARGAVRSEERVAGPEVSLEGLNPGENVRDVAAHFSLDVEIVRIPVIVEDSRGNFVTGLEPDDFGVLDGGPPARPIHQLIREDAPASVGVLIDASDTARDNTPSILHAVTVLLGQFRPEDEVFLLQFGDEPELLGDFTSVDSGLLPAVAAYRPGGGRALRDAVAAGLIRMREATHDKRSLVVVAFGGDEGSGAAVEEVRRAAQREGVSIYVLLLPDGLSRWRPGQEDTAPTHLLQRLAFETGGLVALRPPTAERYGGPNEWTEEAASDVGSYIKHQYLLQFESVDPPPRGEWRVLRVRVAVPHDQIRARSGYVR